MATVANICNYNPLTTISKVAIDDKFRTVHRYLCYLGSSTGNSSVSPGDITIGGTTAMRYSTVDFVGDGVTTILIIPHGLGAIPSAYMVFNDSALTTNFLNRNITVDATNITVTFANAPGVGEDATFSWLVLL